jgi:hypothetical protein
VLAVTDDKIVEMKAKLQESRRVNDAQGYQPFALSEWRTFALMKSKVWAYDYKTGTVRKCRDVEDAKVWLGGRARVLEYESEENMNQVLRSMS